MLIAPDLLEGVDIGDASFYSGDFVLYDYTSTGGWLGFTNMLFFETFDSTLKDRPNNNGTGVQIPGSPAMWSTGSPTTNYPGGSALVGVRCREIVSGSAWNTEGGAVGTWVQMNTSRVWTVAVGNTTTGVFELSLWADTTSVKARARLTCIGPPS